MNDDELGAWLGLSPKQFAVALAKMTPKRRAMFERLKQVEDWDAGIVERKPEGIFADFAKRRSRAEML